jgi:preprotein translocase subunit YajC
MFIVSRSPKLYLLSLAVSVGIFLIIYFTVIRPDNNAANNALRLGQQQEQQALQQASSVAKSTGAPASVSSSVNAATNYASCVVAAGTDTGKFQVCATKYAH